jgi:hypothetical protein
MRAFRKIIGSGPRILAVMSSWPCRGCKPDSTATKKGTEMPTAGQQPRPLPAPNNDFYELAEALNRLLSIRSTLG